MRPVTWSFPADLPSLFLLLLPPPPLLSLPLITHLSFFALLLCSPAHRDQHKGGLSFGIDTARWGLRPLLYGKMKDLGIPAIKPSTRRQPTDFHQSPGHKEASKAPPASKGGREGRRNHLSASKLSSLCHPRFCHQAPCGQRREEGDKASSVQTHINPKDDLPEPFPSVLM